MTVPPADASLPRAVRFARLWRAGGVRSVEAFLAADGPDASRDDLLDLIQQEMQLRDPAAPTADEYRARFPAVADQIGALFAMNALLDGSADPTDTLDLPQYRIEGRLGRGAIGEVYRARDEVLGRPLAVKVLRPEWRDDPAAADRFWDEACTAARLQHPGVAPVYEAGYSDRDRPYIAMKLVEGRTLAHLLADRASPADGLDRLTGVFEQVCQTVAYAHARGVIHRDLKPANVMVGAFGEVQVMDWGLAKEVGSVECEVRSENPADFTPHSPLRTPHLREMATQAGAMIGTPAYAAPEQTRGDHARVGFASDVFGLGAILCEILTGRPPFDSVEAARAGDVGSAHERVRAAGGFVGTGVQPVRPAGQVELLSPRPNGLVALAIACLSADPADRPPDGAAVATAISAYQANQQARLRAAELAAARAEAETKARRRAERLRLVGVLLGVAVGIAAWAWFARQAAIARDVTAATDEGRALRDEMVRVGGDPALLAAADRAARRAEGRLHGVVGRDDLRGRVSDLLTDLEADARDPELVRRLERIRLDRSSVWEGELRAMDAEYVAAFHDSGIDIDADPDDVAGRIRGRAVRAQLVAALDYWASLSARTPNGGGRAGHLFAITRRADPDDRRNAVRDALRAGDAAGLLAVAGTSELPAPLWVTVGTMLAKHPDHGPDGVRVLHAARRRHPDDFWANDNLAFYLCQAERKFGDAIPYFTAAVALRPGFARVRVNLGNAYRAAGNLPAAIAAHRDAIDLQPDLAVAHFNLSNALDDAGDGEAAVTHAREAVRLDPGYRNGFFRLGALCARIGARDDACAALGRAAETTAESECHVAYADALKELGRFAEAVAVLKRLQDQVKDDPLAVPVGLFVEQAEQMVGIERELTRVGAGPADPPTAEALWMTAWVCALTRRDAMAVRLARKALSADPRCEHRPAGQTELFHVVAAVRAGDRGTALDWLRRELEAKSRDPAARPAVRVWRQHRDLAPVREAAALPPAERAAWAKFWAEVEAVAGPLP